MAGFDELLTPTETLILHKLASGRTSGELAQQLGIAARAVERHASSVYRKTGARDRMEASVWARDQGTAP